MINMQDHVRPVTSPTLIIIAVLPNGRHSHECTYRLGGLMFFFQVVCYFCTNAHLYKQSLDPYSWAIFSFQIETPTIFL